VPPGAGEFMVTAVATQKGAKLGEDRQLLVCEAGDRELADLRAKPDLMASIARASGGQPFALTDRQGPPAASVLGSPPPVTVEYRHTPLWDRSWWLGAIVLLLTVEWTLRRLNGMA